MIANKDDNSIKTKDLDMSLIKEITNSDNETLDKYNEYDLLKKMKQWIYHKAFDLTITCSNLKYYGYLKTRKLSYTPNKSFKREEEFDLVYDACVYINKLENLKKELHSDSTIITNEKAGNNSNTKAISNKNLGISIKIDINKIPNKDKMLDLDLYHWLDSIGMDVLI